MERVDSGETDESPFCSNLVTPTDDQTIPFLLRPQLRDGIEEKLFVAKASLDYFASGRTDIENGLRANDNGIELDTTLLEAPEELETKNSLVPTALSHTSESLITEDGVCPQISINAYSN
jgi:hypothetical protein